MHEKARSDTALPYEKYASLKRSAREFAAGLSNRYNLPEAVGVCGNIQQTMLLHEYLALYNTRYERYKSAEFLNAPETEAMAKWPIFRWIVQWEAESHEEYTEVVSDLEKDIGRKEASYTHKVNTAALANARIVFARMDTAVSETWGEQAVPEFDEDSETFRSMVYLQERVLGTANFLKRSANMLHHMHVETPHLSKKEKCVVLRKTACRVRR